MPNRIRCSPLSKARTTYTRHNRWFQTRHNIPRRVIRDSKGKVPRKDSRKLREYLYYRVSPRHATKREGKGLQVDPGRGEYVLLRSPLTHPHVSYPTVSCLFRRSCRCVNDGAAVIGLIGIVFAVAFRSTVTVAVVSAIFQQSRCQGSLLLPTSLTSAASGDKSTAKEEQEVKQLEEKKSVHRTGLDWNSRIQDSLSTYLSMAPVDAWTRLTFVVSPSLEGQRHSHPLTQKPNGTRRQVPCRQNSRQYFSRRFGQSLPCSGGELGFEG